MLRFLLPGWQYKQWKKLPFALPYTLCDATGVEMETRARSQKNKPENKRFRFPGQAYVPSMVFIANEYLYRL
ncbi:MAG TPA: hypothetical protein VF610_13170 [Segetibacter sp.]